MKKLEDIRALPISVVGTTDLQFCCPKCGTIKLFTKGFWVNTSHIEDYDHEKVVGVKNEYVLYFCKDCQRYFVDYNGPHDVTAMMRRMEERGKSPTKA